MIYAPEPPLGLKWLCQDPIVVEVIEQNGTTARIRRPVAESALVNIFRSKKGLPPLTEVETDVLAEFLRPIQ